MEVVEGGGVAGNFDSIMYMVLFTYLIVISQLTLNCVSVKGSVLNPNYRNDASHLYPPLATI